MVAFMEGLRREQGRNPSAVETFLSSHPAPGERAQRLRGTVQRGGNRDSAAFRGVKARLAKMPAAPGMKR
jgi:predicted Zn-dependent protease